MKIKIEVDSTIQETEVLIRCAALSSEIVKLEKMLAEYANAPSMLAVYSADKEHYLSMDQLLFFESDGDCIMAHTKEHAYECTYRLYELEAMLPVSFMRVSKSTILNINKIASITKGISANTLVEFYGSHKSVYVSRHYTKQLKEKLLEKRVL